MGDVNARLNIFTATALGSSTVASRTLDRLHLRGSPRTHLIEGWVDPRTSGHEGVKKNLHPFDIQDRTQAVYSIAKRLAAWATWPKIVNNYVLKYTYTIK